MVELDLQAIGVGNVIIIHTGDVVTSGSLDTRIQGSDNARCLACDDDNARIIWNHASQLIEFILPDDQQLERTKRLLKNAVDGGECKLAPLTYR